MELQQNRPRPVEVAAVRDSGVYVVLLLIVKVY